MLYSFRQASSGPFLDINRLESLLLKLFRLPLSG